MVFLSNFLKLNYNYFRGKLLDSQALIISHRNDPELALADDVDNFLIVYSSLAMRGISDCFVW